MAKNLSIIIPSFNEANNLEKLIPAIHLSCKNYIPDYEIIIVDTVHPLDDTRLICTKYSASYFNRQPTNCYGDAIRTGIGVADSDWVLFMDADLSHNPDYIPAMFNSTIEYDIVCGSRYIEGGYTRNNFLQRIMSRFLNMVFARALKLNIKDISNSFKIFKLKTLKNNILLAKNFDIIEEMLYVAYQNGDRKILELPITFDKRLYGETKRETFIFIISFFKTLINLLKK